MSKVRTRYAPSPTGQFHIGGARTALFNYLYAKHNNGEFIFRIEDTDVERNVDGGVDSQLSNLKWLNIFADESLETPTEYGPYVQSMKLDVYRQYAQKLLDLKLAYRCFCTSEELSVAREESLARGQTPKYSRKCFRLTEKEIQEKLDSNVPFAVRLYIQQDKKYRWLDLIRGDIIVPAESMTDPIILKSNKIATYNFAVVIDDHDMNITHILRGEEHISNTPYQIAIKEALGFEDYFQYGHLSIIIDDTGKKLSKRNLDIEQFIEGFMHKGYTPEALINFIALLGWSDPDNKEILSMSELIKKFSLDRIGLSPAFFDIKKLNWISNEYFKKMDPDVYCTFVMPFLNLNNPLIRDKEKQLALLFKKELHYAQELNDLIEQNFLSNLSWENIDIKIKEWLKINSSSKIFAELFKQLSSIQVWDSQNIKTAIKTVGSNIQLEGSKLFMPIRMSLTGQEHGPDLSSIISLYDKKQVLLYVEEVSKNLN
ncbi:glutamate--tRNA ligase [Mycoplasmoides pirum]|uniref:glutamate--tRNA ligase n=1 Tax=Mycoplasmoides pirum TaxID=2122 RepID=UPI000483E055|nr:glutamate--tRNA ligase [Mycoplasmoides pirum]